MRRKTIKIGDSVYFGLGYGIVTQRKNPTGHKYQYTIKLIKAHEHDDRGCEGKEYTTYYCVLDTERR